MMIIPLVRFFYLLIIIIKLKIIFKKKKKLVARKRKTHFLAVGFDGSGDPQSCMEEIKGEFLD
jgi:hypothetical protein